MKTQSTRDDGKELDTSGVTQSPPVKPLEPGRGKLILMLGISSLLLIPGDIILGVIVAGDFSYNKFDLFRSIQLLIILLAPILGISAWLMANKDLRKIREGIVPASARDVTKTGKILGKLGTLVVDPCIFIIAISFSMYTVCTIPCNKEAMINDLKNLSAHAYQYRIRPASKGGGGGSYTGYAVPATLSKNENGAYTATVVHADTVQFNAKSVQDAARTIEVKIDGTGRPTGAWTYGGDFK